MLVKAAPGTRVPKEGKPRDYITDQEAVTVPATAFYRRLVADGSLVEPPPEKTRRGGAQARPETQEAT